MLVGSNMLCMMTSADSMKYFDANNQLLLNSQVIEYLYKECLDLMNVGASVGSAVACSMAYGIPSADIQSYNSAVQQYESYLLPLLDIVDKVLSGKLDLSSNIKVKETINSLLETVKGLSPEAYNEGQAYEKQGEGLMGDMASDIEFSNNDSAMKLEKNVGFAYQANAGIFSIAIMLLATLLN